MKGVNVGNHCVIEYGSLLTKADSEEHILYAGVLVKPIRKEINWIEKRMFYDEKDFGACSELSQ